MSSYHLNGELLARLIKAGTWIQDNTSIEWMLKYSYASSRICTHDLTT
jgi:hypothetical protein